MNICVSFVNVYATYEHFPLSHAHSGMRTSCETSTQLKWSAHTECIRHQQTMRPWSNGYV